MNFIRKFYLRTGLTLAIIFPAIFVFDKTENNLIESGLLFFLFFFFILLLWLYNAIYIDFGKLLRSGNYRPGKAIYRHIVFSLLLSIPLYFTLGVIFRQEQVLFSSLFDNDYSLKAWFYILLRIVLFDVGLLIAKFIIDNNIEKQRIILENEILKTEQLRATHETFKQQVDPHFLFNSLNTLQSLVKQQHTEITLQFIRELSQVYRYMLIRRDNDYVSLGEEIDFLKSYLYLLKIRFGNSFNTVININEKHICTKIPVHTLQLLAENAVKHNSVTERNPLLLEITSANNELVVCNNILLKQQNVESSGIGLQNINKRYSLLFSKEITIIAENSYFKVLLPIID